MKSRVVDPMLKLDCARQYDPVVLRDGFQFFFIKQYRLYTPVPTQSAVTLVQQASSHNSVDIRFIVSWLC